MLHAYFTMTTLWVNWFDHNALYTSTRLHKDIIVYAGQTSGNTWPETKCLCNVCPKGAIRNSICILINAVWFWLIYLEQCINFRLFIINCEALAFLFPIIKKKKIRLILTQDYYWIILLINDELPSATLSLPATDKHKQIKKIYIGFYNELEWNAKCRKLQHFKKKKFSQVLDCK